jgi:hypothetical protein
MLMDSNKNLIAEHKVYKPFHDVLCLLAARHGFQKKKDCRDVHSTEERVKRLYRYKGHVHGESH